MMLRSMYGLFILATAWLPKGPLRICDFGCQLVPAADFPELQSKYFGLVPSRVLFRQLEHEYISLDINGKYGALSVDLGKPLSAEVLQELGTFHVVSSFGTIEHIENDMVAFSNADTLCKAGGVLLYTMPREGTYEGHGLRHYTEESMLALARTYEYKVRCLVDLPVRSNDFLITTIFQKVV